MTYGTSAIIFETIKDSLRNIKKDRQGCYKKVDNYLQDVLREK